MESSFTFLPLPGKSDSYGSQMRIANQAQIIRPSRQHRRRHADFRKACRSRFHSHPLQSQPLAGNARTCLEGPFGELLRATGPMAKTNPFRFSTKYQDGETDLLYYGYRYYNASMGRWISRDLIGEWGGQNLYGFVLNRVTSQVDRDGRIPIEGPAPTVRCRKCACKSVTISGSPVAPPGLGWYIAGNPGNSYGMYGSLMTITWQVIGDPRECTYGQDESGHTIATSSTGPRRKKEKVYENTQDVSKVAPVTYASTSATYHDEMGIGFKAPRDNGEWEYKLDLTINFTCTSSDGTKMTGATHHFAEDGTLYFWGKGDE